MKNPSLLVAAALSIAACERSEPPSRPAPPTQAARPTEPSRLPKPSPSASASAKPPASAIEPAPSLSAAAGPPDAGSAEELSAPGLVGSDGKPLAQTEDKPSLESAWFKSGIRAVFRAIQSDDPGLAKAFFFPLEAYRQVKDVKDPDRDWHRRLMANFERDVHAYHKKLGSDAERARFVSIEVAEEKLRWMKKGSEGNKLPYFRVTHSKLNYETADGKSGAIEVTSFISWRGEWYIVHLNGFE